MAMINATNYTNAGAYANAGGSVRQAGERGSAGLFQSPQGEDRYGLANALSRAMPPVTVDVTPATGTQGVLPQAAGVPGTGPMDVFLRTPANETVTSNAVYGPFTHSSDSIRGNTTATLASARSSARTTARGIAAYRNTAAAATAGINTLA